MVDFARMPPNHENSFGKFSQADSKLQLRTKRERAYQRRLLGNLNKGNIIMLPNHSSHIFSLYIISLSLSDLDYLQTLATEIKTGEDEEGMKVRKITFEKK